MPRAKLTCRVCGKDYEACLTPNYQNIFRWRDVACSIECGSEYLRRIEESRKPEAKKKKSAKQKDDVIDEI